ncbi:MAG: hypothetical protein DRI57_18355 [Deltaproteobacteria bacterium]|nr:MAG: hypothetical protein DRI57_18355 [Deltaproteobacteria bacterium]
MDSIICSIDGIHKETHEAIRGGTDFDQIVANVHRFIELRNKFGKTRVLVRFIRQEKNRSESDAFKAYWKEKLDSELGDDTKVQNLLEGEYFRRLARYRHADFLLTLKYGMTFDEFIKQRVVRQKNCSWDSESDAMKWETAVSGIKTMERHLRELQEAEYV